MITVLQPVSALPVGSVHDFDVVTQPLATVKTVTATVRAATTVRPGLELTFWVEDSVWNTQQMNGLNLATPSDRQFVVDEFADWVTRVLMPKLEGSFFNLTEVNNSPSPGLNILMLDMEDGFQDSGSFIGASFDSNDQNLTSGLNGMNLIYLDVNPGTLGSSLYSGVSKRRTYIELVRALSRLAQFQKDSTEEEWIREGIAQMMVYRFLNQEVFPNSLSRIIDAPNQGIDELDDYFQNISSMYPEYELAQQNINRVRVFSNPRDPRDNSDGPAFRSFHYLFFTNLFHKAGGSFQTRVTDGDRFFRDLMIQSKDGLEGLQIVLNQYNLGSFEDLYVNFVLSLVVRTTENQYITPAINLSRFSFVNYDLANTLPSSFISRLTSFGVDVKRVQNTSSADQYEIQMIIPSGLGQSKIYLLREDVNGNSYVEKQLTIEDLKELLLPGVEKQALIINLDNQTKDFLTQLVRSDLSNPSPQVLEPNSSGEFGANTSAIVLSPEQVSTVLSTGVSGTIDLSFSASGVFSLPFSNNSSSTLRLSLPNNIVTTAITMDFHNETKLSVNSLIPVTGERFLLLSGNSSTQIIFMNENTIPVTVSLTYDVVDSSLFPILDSPSTVESSSTALSQEELEKLAGGGAGGCFIASASFGNYKHPFVEILCLFRDKYLLSNTVGQNVVAWYYLNSPALAKIISSSKSLQLLGQLLLLPLVIFALIMLNPMICTFILILACLGMWKGREC